MQPVDRFGKPFCTLEYFVQSFFEDLRVKQLFTVFPFVDCFGFVESFVALKSDKGKFEHLCGGFGELRFTNAGRAFDEHRLAQLIRKIHGGRDLAAANITM